MGAESSEDGRRADATPWQSKWRRKIVHAAGRAGYVADGAELFESAAGSKRRDQRHRATPVRHLERLPGLDKVQYLARSLTERANSDRLHVLLVAHFWVPTAVYKGYVSTPVIRTKSHRAIVRDVFRNAVGLTRLIA
jgi:hypothetical protein